MLKPKLIDPIVKLALQEDIGAQDITTEPLIPKTTHIKADIEFEEAGVLCGIEVCERAFRLVNEDLRFLPVAADGEWIDPKREVAYIEGEGAAILMAERTALNLMSHLSGIATKTKAFVDKIKGTKAKIFETRKTTPGLRYFEKYAVRMGGGSNHRFGLYDQVLIKDNHLRILRKDSLETVVNKVRSQSLKKTIIGIEVKNLEEVKVALGTKVNYILLDNMPVEMVEKALELRQRAKSQMEYEVSGGIHLGNVLSYAKTGIERISIGCITHSAPAINISLDIVD